MSITRTQNDIYYAVAYTLGDNPFGRLEMVIPEPATLSLLAVGMLLAQSRRKN